MKRRKLGTQGLEVSALGLGCMGMSWAYGKPDEKEVVRTLHRALDLGVDFWDTAEIYGPFTNEELLGKVLEGKRDKVTLATKFAFKIGPDGSRLGLDSSPAHIRKTIEGSLKRLRTDHIDLYYQHRLDPNTPIEDTVGAMAELVKQGKVRYLGLSEVGPTTIHRANAVHPISAVQSEYSLWERGLEEKVIPMLQSLNIGLVAYSPVGRGFLTGAMKPVDELDPDDFRRMQPRLSGDNLKQNQLLLNALKDFSSTKKMTASQVALAWVLHQGSDVVPIPGTTKVKHLEENCRAAELTFTERELGALDRIVREHRPSGLRYTQDMMKTIDTD